MKRMIKASIDYTEDDHIMGILREMAGYDADDDEYDDEVLRYFDTPNSVFDAVCDFEGLTDFGETIREWVTDVYGIDLSEIK